jgi:oxalate---CoA ligase
MQHMPSSKVGQGTLGEEIERHSVARPDQAAVVCTGYAPLSYRELQGLIKEFRKALRGAGFSRTARIGIALPNGPHAALAIVAVACSAVAVPLNPKQTLAEMEKCLSVLRLNAILLFRDEDSAARQAATLKSLAIIEVTRSGERTLGFDIGKTQAVAAATIEEPDEPHPDAPAFILQTSGTTAESKLVPTSHRNMLAAAARVRAWFKLTPDDRCLSVSPVFYAHGLHVTAFAPLLSGGSVAFPTDASKFDYSEWFGALKPTWYSAGPTLHRLIFDQIKSRAAAKADHSLRFALSGGAPLPRDVSEGLRGAFGVPVVEHYGSSEGMQICSNQLTPGSSKPGTCGIPWPNTIKIVDEAGRQVPQGQQGEVLVGGPTLISGYLDAPELNRESFVDGWFKTGDIGSFDDEGFLTLHGRLKDLINRGGEKVSPLDIDDALLHHPAVAEAAAFAVPHPRLGEDVAAVVVLKPGMTTTPLELRNSLSEKLASFKVPRRIIIADRLPKGSTGKVLRRLLSESYGAQSVGSPETLNKSVDNKLLLQLRDVWERHLNSGPLTIDDDFFEKGGDSLLATEMLSEIERLTGIHLPDTAILDAPTVRALAQRIEQSGSMQSDSLIELRRGGPRNLFMVHDGDGETLLYLNLARRMPDDLAVFGIEPRRVAAGPLAHTTIEGMAAFYLEEMRKKQPRGPYLLGGLCAGGVIAYEMAAQLERAGESVQLVALLDAAAPRALKRRGRIAKARLGRLQRILEQAGSGPVGRVRQGRLLISAISQKMTNALTWEVTDRYKRWSVQARFRLGFLKGLSVRQIYDCAEASYLPKPLAIASVVLARARHGEGGDTAYRQIYADESFGWGGLTHNLTIVDVDGGHFSMLQKDFVDSLAKTMTQYVDAKPAVSIRARAVEATVL